MQRAFAASSANLVGAGFRARTNDFGASSGNAASVAPSMSAAYAASLGSTGADSSARTRRGLDHGLAPISLRGSRAAETAVNKLPKSEAAEPPDRVNLTDGAEEVAYGTSYETSASGHNEDAQQAPSSTNSNDAAVSGITGVSVGETSASREGVRASAPGFDALFDPFDDSDDSNDDSHELSDVPRGGGGHGGGRGGDESRYRRRRERGRERSAHYGSDGAGGGSLSSRSTSAHRRPPQFDGLRDPFSDPFGDPSSDPFGDPFGDPSGDPFSDPFGDPFGGPISYRDLGRGGGHRTRRRSGGLGGLDGLDRLDGLGGLGGVDLGLDTATARQWAAMAQQGWQQAAPRPARTRNVDGGRCAAPDTLAL